MIDSDQTVAVLAWADELGQHHELLAAWASTFTADDDVTLVILPGACTEEEVEPQVRAAIAAAGIENGERFPDLLAITRALPHEAEVDLARRCAAVYGRRQPAEPFRSLPHLDERSVASLRRLLPTSGPSGHARTGVRQRHSTRLSDTARIVHRGSEADLGVLQQVFGDECFSLRHFDRWPGLRRCGQTSSQGRRPLIVDCGANIGASSVYFSMLHPSARIVALEPELENFRLLCENVLPLPAVAPLNQAIASQRGTLVLSDPGIGEWGYRTGAQGWQAGVIGEVEAVSISDLLDDEPDVVPFILKVDIEGAEADLFSRHTEVLARFPLVIVELHDWMLPGEGTSQSFLRWHLSQPRDFVHRGENVYSLASSLCDQ